MDLGPVDRITTDAVGEPGSRVFYLQARQGDELVTVVVEKEQVQLLAASVLELLANVERETGAGPGDEEMDLEEPVEPRWRAGRLSIGLDEDRDLFLLELEEYQPELEEDDDPSWLLLDGPADAPAVGDARADAGADPARGRRRRARPAGLPVLRQPDRPGGPRVPRHERALERA